MSTQHPQSTPDDGQQSTVVTEMGAYCVTPLWVVLATASNPRALTLWCYLYARWADRSTRACWPGRETIAADLGCSVDTVDRSIASLVSVGALKVRPRFRQAPDGSQTSERTSNEYVIVTTQPAASQTWPQDCGDPQEVAADLRRPSPQACGDRGRTVAAGVSNQENHQLGEPGTPTSAKADETLFPPATGLAVVPPSPPAPVAEDPKVAKAAEVTRVAEHVVAVWCEATGRNPNRTKLNQARRSKVQARLNEGYTEDDLLAAIRGMALSPFHRGDNVQGTRYDTIEVALRTGSQVEKFAEDWQAHMDGSRRSGPRSATDDFLDAFEAHERRQA